jgi:hypothetical protein
MSSSHLKILETDFEEEATLQVRYRSAPKIGTERRHSDVTSALDASIARERRSPAGISTRMKSPNAARGDDVHDACLSDERLFSEIMAWIAAHGYDNGWHFSPSRCERHSISVALFQSNRRLERRGGACAVGQNPNKFEQSRSRQTTWCQEGGTR